MTRTLIVDYHFDSEGKKLPNKWDSFDVSEELKKVDDDANKKSASPKVKRLKKIPSSSRLLKSLAEIEHELEEILKFLDNNVRGDDIIRGKRRKTVLVINDRHIKRVEKMRANVLEWMSPKNTLIDNAL